MICWWWFIIILIKAQISFIAYLYPRVNYILSYYCHKLIYTFIYKYIFVYDQRPVPMAEKRKEMEIVLRKIRSKNNRKKLVLCDDSKRNCRVRKVYNNIDIHHYVHWMSRAHMQTMTRYSIFIFDLLQKNRWL